jgi:AcrR family transcriptional regulator
VGPARTTVSEIAKRAGVRRATVYNHFPSDLELIDACSSHWVAENPPPDPAPWVEIRDPARRVEVALAAMYDYYDRGKDMLANVLRDEPLVPALAEINGRKWWPAIEQLVELLAGGWEDDTEADRAERRATLRVALDFFTWQTLARSGLPNDRAAHLAAGWIRQPE